MTTVNKFFPNYAIHPGETLKEKLEEMEMSAKEFAVRTGKPEKTISEIINAKSSITPDMAILFEKVLGIPANFWMKKQANYSEFLAREKQKEELEQAKDWARCFPYSEMWKLGLVKKAPTIEEKADELLHYFGVSNPTAWEGIYMKQQSPMYFRISLKHDRNPYALSALLKMGEKKAMLMQAPDYDKNKLKSILPEIKSVLVEKPDDFLLQIQELCLTAGVKVVYTPQLPKTVIHGVAKWHNDSPIIQMTDRLKRYDVFCFSFFHELGHILLHGNKKNIFLDAMGNQEKDQQELEADEFAAEWLLKEKEYYEIIDTINSGEDEIKDVILSRAQKFETHKDFIIGRILHNNKDLYKYGFLQNELCKIDFSDLIEF